MTTDTEKEDAIAIIEDMKKEEVQRIASSAR